MARKVPADRFQTLVDCATQVFIEQGYARTQMADVAEAMGVAKGTLYLYVESKEALFDLVVRSLGAEQPLATPPKLPHPTPKPGATLRFLRKRVSEQPPSPALLAALGRKRVADPRAELEAVVREIHHTLSANRRGIKLMDRSAQFHPELSAVWFSDARRGLIRALATYLRNRIAQRQLKAVPDPEVAARVILETITTWAVHRHWDPSPESIDDQIAEDTVVQFIVGGLKAEEEA